MNACKTIRTITLNLTKGINWMRTLQGATTLDKPLSGMIQSSGSWLVIKIKLLHLLLLTIQINKIRTYRGNAWNWSILAFTLVAHMKEAPCDASVLGIFTFWLLHQAFLYKLKLLLFPNIWKVKHFEKMIRIIWCLSSLHHFNKA